MTQRDPFYTQPHHHSPSTIHMGDCHICGNTQDAPLHNIPFSVTQHLIQTTSPKWQLFIDCDGVVADFDNYFEQEFGSKPREYEDAHGTDAYWELIRSHRGFYRHMPKMEDADTLIEAVRHLRPILLTGYPKQGVEWAIHQKILWAEENFKGIIIMTCLSKHKSLFCQPGDVLIDDWTKYKHRWEGAGGTFIKHVDARSSLETLRGLRHV